MSDRTSRSGRLSRTSTALAAAVGLTLAAGGVAAAAIPDAATKTISACYATTGGALRVIDPAAGQQCKTTEKPLSWRSNGIVHRGAWTSATAYRTGDAVSFNGSSYVATANSQGATPSTSGGVWGVLAAAGARGPAGPAGPTGATGPAGPAGPAGPGGKLYLGYSRDLKTITTRNGTVVAQTAPVAAGQYQTSGKVWVSNGGPTEIRIFCDLSQNPGTLGDRGFVNLAPGDNATISLIGAWNNTDSAARASLLCYSDADPTGVRLQYGAIAVTQVGSLDVTQT